MFNPLFKMLSLFFITTSVHAAFIKSEPGPGRLGDQLYCYIKAKWMAYKLDLPFLFDPFPGYEMFAIEERWMSSDLLDQYPLYKTSQADFFYPIDPKSTYIYPITFRYWDEAMIELFEIASWEAVFQEEPFLKEIRKQLAPVDVIPQIEVPDGLLPVALHIRVGDTFDGKLASLPFKPDYLQPAQGRNHTSKKRAPDKRFPMKFPPLQYYIDALVALSKQLGDPPLFVYIFTDAKEPHKVKEMIESQLPLAQALVEVSLSFSQKIDFFQMKEQFKYLIRSASHFSQIAHLLGDFELVAYPKAHHWHKHYLEITQIGWYKKQDHSSTLRKTNTGCTS